MSGKEITNPLLQYYETNIRDLTAKKGIANVDYQQADENYDASQERYNVAFREYYNSNYEIEEYQKQIEILQKQMQEEIALAGNDENKINEIKTQYTSQINLINWNISSLTPGNNNNRFSLSEARNYRSECFSNKNGTEFDFLFYNRQLGDAYYAYGNAKQQDIVFNAIQNKKSGSIFS